MNRKHGLLALLVLLTTALACVIPGTTTSAPLPTPTADTRLEIMVAETVSAALQMTQQPMFIVEETEAPETVPTEIPATATPSAETTLDKNEDGSNIFTDFLGGYQLTVPAPWLALRIDSPEYDAALTLPEASNPAIQRSLSTIQAQDPDVFRLFALDVNEEHLDGGFVTNINLVWDQQEKLSLPNDARLAEIADALPSAVEGTEVLYFEVRTSQSGVPYGVITSQMRGVTQDGTNLVIRQKMVFFDLPVGALSITLSTTETLLETIEPSFDAMIETFAVME